MKQGDNSTSETLRRIKSFQSTSSSNHEAPKNTRPPIVDVLRNSRVMGSGKYAKKEQSESSNLILDYVRNLPLQSPRKEPDREVARRPPIVPVGTLGTRKYKREEPKKKHYHYPYYAGYGLKETSVKYTDCLFDLISTMPVTGFSKDLTETPLDRAADRRLNQRFKSFSVLGDRSIILKHLFKFVNVDTERTSSSEIYEEKGYGELYKPDIKYDYNRPLLLLKDRNENGDLGWWYIKCYSRNHADKLKYTSKKISVINSLSRYGEVVDKGLGKLPPPKHPDWYEWDKDYYKTLLAIEFCLEEGASFTMNGKNAIEEAAKRNNTELFAYLLLQAWDKEGYYAQADLSEIKRVDPFSIREYIRVGISMGLFWAIQHGNPVMADLALHYGADINHTPEFSDVTPLELALYYKNDLILDRIEDRVASVRHRVQQMRRSGIKVPNIDKYYRKKAVYITENIEVNNSQKRATFVSLFNRLKKNNFLYSKLQESLALNISDDAILEYQEFSRRKNTSISSDMKRKLQSGEKLEVMMPQELLKAADLTEDQYWQIFKEITTAALLDQEYSMNLKSIKENQILRVFLPASLRDTLAGQIAMDADYFMKTSIVYPGTYFSPDYQKPALKAIKSSTILSSISDYSKEAALRFYRKNNAIILSDSDEFYDLEYSKIRDHKYEHSYIERHVGSDLTFDRCRVMFDVCNPSIIVRNNKIISTAYSQAQHYFEYKDANGNNYPKIIPLEKSFMSKFNKLGHSDPLSKKKFARLDIAYKLYSIACAYVENGRVPNFPDTQQEYVETPMLLPPLLKICISSACGKDCGDEMSIFGGVAFNSVVKSQSNLYVSTLTASPWAQAGYNSEKYKDAPSVTLSQLGYDSVSRGMGSRPICTNPGEKIGYHATQPQWADSILQEGFRQGTAPGRLGAGTYVNSTPEGALAEFYSNDYNKSEKATVIRTLYKPGIEAKTDRAPDKKYGYEVNNEECKKVGEGLGPIPNYRANMPFGDVDSISAPSVRYPKSTNTNVLNSSNVRAVDKQGCYYKK